MDWSVNAKCGVNGVAKEVSTAELTEFTEDAQRTGYHENALIKKGQRL